MYTSFTDWESGLYLEHHGIKGMSWGRRRWQNPDGSLTAAGREHYGVGQGGNKRMERLYNRQTRKLNKLISRTDIETQRANAQKYNKRAKIAAGVGLGAAGIAGGARLRNVMEKARVKKLLAGMDADWDSTLSGMDHDVRKLWKADTQAYDAAGKWTGKGYSKSTWDSIDRVMESGNAKLDDIDRSIAATKSAFNKAANIRKAITYGAAGVAAVSAGFAAYNKVQAHLAKVRTTEIGHQKAVQKARAQVEKMEKMFANTPYSELVKQQSKKANKS